MDERPKLGTHKRRGRVKGRGYAFSGLRGTAITARLKAELAQFGFDDFQETPQGFRALRPMPPMIWSRN
jgi:hypothetical protein